jgi:hypothetical protein
VLLLGQVLPLAQQLLGLLLLLPGLWGLQQQLERGLTDHTVRCQEHLELADSRQVKLGSRHGCCCCCCRWCCCCCWVCTRLLIIPGTVIII